MKIRSILDIKWDLIWKCFERQALLFPLIVIFIVSLTFIFGGHCAAWQWWVSVVLMLIFPFAVRTDRRAALASGGLFLLMLALMCICVLLTRDSYWVDAVAYHLPATRLLIEGWNPFTDATPATLGAAMNIDPEEMRMMHVLFLQKAAWFFNAAAFFCHGDWQSVTTPIEYYAFFMTAVVLWRTLSSWQWPFRLLLLFALWTFCAGHSSGVVNIASMTVVDDVCAMMVFALLVVMTQNLVRNEISWKRLIPLTLLAIVVKSSGGLACFVLWAFFAVVFLVRNRSAFGKILVRFVTTAIALTVYFAIVCASPYIAAYRDYGHPFYPIMTVDEEKLPTTDFILDLNMGTSDYNAMGPVGFFVNAYISPSLAQGYYRHKLGTEVFHPTCSYWRGESSFIADLGGDEETSPIRFADRAALWIAFAILLSLSGWRLLPAMAFLLLLVAPSHTYGYLRYFKWAEMLLPFAIIALSQFGWTKLGPFIEKWRAVRFIPLALAVVFSGIFGWSAVDRFKQDLEEKRYVREFVPPKYIYSSIYAPFHYGALLKMRHFAKSCTDPRQQINPIVKAHSGWRENSARVGMNSFKMLARRMPNLQKTEVLPLTSDIRDNPGVSMRYEPFLDVYVLDEHGVEQGNSHE